MPQYPVPQFIEEEGRIIFFLTFRQFFLLIGGGVICFGSFMLLPLILAIFITVITVPLTIALAFVKINNQSVVKALLSYLGFVTGQKDYTWKK